MLRWASRVLRSSATPLGGIRHTARDLRRGSEVRRAGGCINLHQWLSPRECDAVRLLLRANARAFVHQKRHKKSAGEAGGKARFEGWRLRSRPERRGNAWLDGPSRPCPPRRSLSRRCRRYRLLRARKRRPARAGRPIMHFDAYQRGSGKLLKISSVTGFGAPPIM